jgi:hypothetical protein
VPGEEVFDGNRVAGPEPVEQAVILGRAHTP